MGPQSVAHRNSNGAEQNTSQDLARESLTVFNECKAMQLDLSCVLCYESVGRARACFNTVEAPKRILEAKFLRADSSSMLCRFRLPLTLTTECREMFWHNDSYLVHVALLCLLSKTWREKEKKAKHRAKPS